jgi:hypothetical protein
LEDCAISYFVFPFDASLYVCALFATVVQGLTATRRMPMSKRYPLADTFSFKIAVFFLAFSVVAWGLQAKLSLYKVAQSPSMASVAKLSTEKRSSATLASIVRATKLPQAWEKIQAFSLTASIHAIPTSSLRGRHTDVKPSAPFLCALRSPGLMRRPPPALT